MDDPKARIAGKLARIPVVYSKPRRFLGVRLPGETLLDAYQAADALINQEGLQFQTSDHRWVPIRNGTDVNELSYFEQVGDPECAPPEATPLAELVLQAEAAGCQWKAGEEPIGAYEAYNLLSGDWPAQNVSLYSHELPIKPGLAPNDGAHGTLSHWLQRHQDRLEEIRGTAANDPGQAMLDMAAYLEDQSSRPGQVLDGLGLSARVGGPLECVAPDLLESFGSLYADFRSCDTVSAAEARRLMSPLLELARQGVSLSMQGKALRGLGLGQDQRRPFLEELVTCYAAGVGAGHPSPEVAEIVEDVVTGPRDSGTTKFALHQLRYGWLHQRPEWTQEQGRLYAALLKRWEPLTSARLVGRLAPALATMDSQLWPQTIQSIGLLGSLPRTEKEAFLLVDLLHQAVRSPDRLDQVAQDLRQVARIFEDGAGSSVREEALEFLVDNVDRPAVMKRFRQQKDRLSPYQLFGSLGSISAKHEDAELALFDSLTSVQKDFSPRKLRLLIRLYHEQGAARPQTLTELSLLGCALARQIHVGDQLEQLLEIYRKDLPPHPGAAEAFLAMVGEGIHPKDIREFLPLLADPKSAGSPVQKFHRLHQMKAFIPQRKYYPGFKTELSKAMIECLNVRMSQGTGLDQASSEIGRVWFSINKNQGLVSDFVSTGLRERPLNLRRLVGSLGELFQADDRQKDPDWHLRRVHVLQFKSHLQQMNFSTEEMRIYARQVEEGKSPVEALEFVRGLR